MRESPEDILTLIRTQLGRLPVVIAHKEANNLYSFWFKKEVDKHNNTVKRGRRLLD